MNRNAAIDDAGAGPRVLAVCGLAFEAAIAAGPGVVAVCGPGPALAGGRLEERLAARSGVAGGWAGILGFGCAGGLDPALAPGSCVVASAVLCGDDAIETDPAWTRALLARLPEARTGLVAGRDAPLVSVEDKAALRIATGACAVDMESQAAALAARRHGVPFAVLRVVLDPAWRAIPPCALAGLRADGTNALLPLLAGLARDPRQLAPLCALAREAWVARRSLHAVRGRIGAALGLPLAQAPG